MKKPLRPPIDLADVGPAQAEPVEDRRLLLVDDDELVRLTLVRTLSDAFHSVTSVGSAAEAIAVAAAGESFDCVVTDLAMPGMRGSDLVVALRRTRPDLPFLLLTGAGVDAARSELAANGLVGVAILTKPFTPSELVDAVRTQLGQAVCSELSGGAQVGDPVV